MESFGKAKSRRYLGEGTLDEVREKNPKSIVVSLIFKFFGDIRDALNETEANHEKSYN